MKRNCKKAILQPVRKCDMSDSTGVIFPRPLNDFANNELPNDSARKACDEALKDVEPLDERIRRIVREELLGSATAIRLH